MGEKRILFAFIILIVSFFSPLLLIPVPSSSNSLSHKKKILIKINDILN